MKNKFLISVLAAEIIVSFLYAGNLYYNKYSIYHSFPEENISMEYIKSLNDTYPINLGDFNYTPSDIPYQTLANPVLDITMNNAEGVIKSDEFRMVYVCAIDSKGFPKSEPPVLKFDSIYKDTIIFKALNKDSYITNGEHYGFFSDVNETDCAKNIYGHPLPLVSKYNFEVYLNQADPKPIYSTIVLATGDSQQQQDITYSNVPILGVIKQFCAGVSSKFGKSIDPSSGFIAFKQSSAGCLSGNCEDNLDTSDSVTVNILSDACNNIAALNAIYTAKGNIVIHSSKPLPLKVDNTGQIVYGVSYKVTTGLNTDLYTTISVDTSKITQTDAQTFVIPYYLDKINTINTSTPPFTFDKNFSITFQVNLDGKNQIPLSKFTADVNLTTVDVDTPYTETLLKDADAGEWEYNASVATIPYMAADNNTQTAIRVVNPSGIEAEVYWTCRDDEGKEVENMRVKSTEGTDSIKAGGAEAWLASDILKAAQGEDPEFALDGKMSCEVILINGDGGIKVVPVMSIDGKRDRVIPVVKSE